MASSGENKREGPFSLSCYTGILKAPAKNGANTVESREERWRETGLNDNLLSV